MTAREAQVFLICGIPLATFVLAFAFSNLGILEHPAGFLVIGLIGGAIYGYLIGQVK